MGLEGACIAPASGSDHIEMVWEVWCRDSESPKDEYTLKLEGPKKEWWTDTELGLLRDYHFPGIVTDSRNQIDQ